MDSIPSSISVTNITGIHLNIAGLFTVKAGETSHIALNGLTELSRATAWATIKNALDAKVLVMPQAETPSPTPE